MARENKSRVNKVKVLHHSIPGLYPLLAKIAEFDEVQSIIPMHIAPKAKAGRALRFRISRKDESGVRLTCTSNGAAQPVLVTCQQRDRDKIIAKLEKLAEFDDGTQHGRRPRNKKSAAPLMANDLFFS